LLRKEGKQMSSATIMRNPRENQERQIAQQLEAGNFGAPEQIANGIPVLNDEALAKSIEEWRLTDVSYQRAQNERDREEIEAAHVAGQQRLNAAKQQIRDRSALELEQRNRLDATEGERLALEMQTLTDTFPPNWTAETLPMDKLKSLTQLRQRVQEQAALQGLPGLADGVLESGGPLSPANTLAMQQQAQVQARPETFPDGSLYQFENLPDGNVQVKLVTGEIFRGDPIKVTQQIAESKVRTTTWARQKVREAQQTQPMQVDQQPQQITPPEPTQQSTIADYWAVEQAQALAKQFGFSGRDEMLEWGENVNQKMEAIAQYEDDRLALNFTARCPDFPGTPEASDAVVSIVQANGWQYNLDSLQAAHLLAVQNRVYTPLSGEALQAANGNVSQPSRPSAPPMLGGSNPEITHSVPNPFEMPLQDLRKAAIRQQLETNGPNYR
jgi:hypothetical protein